MADDEQLASTELMFLLGLGFQLSVGEFTRRLDERGYADLRPVHGMVFQIVGRAGVTSTELADRLGVTKQAAGQIVDDLERRGYLRRDPHPGGGRRRLVVLTEQGWRHMEVAGSVLRRFEGELADALDDPGLAATRARLARLVRTLAGDAVPPLRPVW